MTKTKEQDTLTDKDDLRTQRGTPVRDASIALGAYKNSKNKGTSSKNKGKSSKNKDA